jgi:hypothetical protein
MKDQADRQTIDIFDSAKRGRGRPSTGKAMTNAERQKAYRLRVKTGQVVQLPTVTEMLNDNRNVTENTSLYTFSEFQKVWADLNKAHKQIASLNGKLVKLQRENEQLKRNVTKNQDDALREADSILLRNA